MLKTQKAFICIKENAINWLLFSCTTDLNLRFLHSKGTTEKELHTPRRYPEDLQERLQTNALLKGGFVKFDFKGDEFLLPKLPLMAYQDENFEGIEFNHGLYTWFFESESKTLKEKILDDIMVVGDVPVHLRHSEHFLSNLKETPL